MKRACLAKRLARLLLIDSNGQRELWVGLSVSKGDGGRNFVILWEETNHPRLEGKT